MKLCLLGSFFFPFCMSRHRRFLPPPAQIISLKTLAFKKKSQSRHICPRPQSPPPSLLSCLHKTRIQISTSNNNKWKVHYYYTQSITQSVDHSLKVTALFVSRPRDYTLLFLSCSSLLARCLSHLKATLCNFLSNAGYLMVESRL